MLPLCLAPAQRARDLLRPRSALLAGGVGLFIVCRLQYGIEPSLSRHVGVVSVDTAKPFAAVLPPMSTYSKATKRVDLRQCKDNPFFVPRNTKWSVKCWRWSKKRRGSRSRAAYLPVPPTPHWPQGLIFMISVLPSTPRRRLRRGFRCEAVKIL